MKQRVIYGGIAAVIFLGFLIFGGLPFQVFVGLLAMLGVFELFRMKGLEIFSFEGLLAMLAAFVLAVPLETYFSSLPVDASFSAFTLISFLILAGTVFNSSAYSFNEAVFPIAASFYVGIGFHYLNEARLDGLNSVLFVVFLVWATDIGAYMIGRQFGRHRLMPKISPNKTVEGSLGGMICAVLVSLIFMLIDRSVYAPHSFGAMALLVPLFSLFAQFGDLVESALKRQFGVKDSGKLIPGHGGILDRFDSMLFVLPIMHFLGLF